MVDLRNWETFAGTGAAVNGATVEVREADLAHPNPNAVLASTTTNADGMWEFTGLSAGPKDVKVTYLGKVKWHKGMAKHSVGLVVGEDFTPASENLLKNGGFEFWRLTSFVLGVAASPIAAAWVARLGTGDSGTLTREASTISPGSKYGAKLVYTKSSGPAYIEQVLPPELAYALRGLDVSISAQVRQGVSSSVKASITDSAGESLGATVATTGSFVTKTVTRTIDAAATTLKAGIQINVSDTIYLDNVILVIGSTPGVYTPRQSGMDVNQVSYEMLDRIFTRQFLFGG